MDNIGLQTALSKLISRIKEQTGADMLLSVHGEERKMDSTSLTCVSYNSGGLIMPLNMPTLRKGGLELHLILAVQVIDNRWFDFVRRDMDFQR